MRDLDETDLEILRLLVGDGRRPYSDIAEAVGLSPPAVSDRVTRLEEQGVIRRFTADVDRSKLRGGVPVLVRLTVDPGRSDGVRDALASLDGVEHVFATASAQVVCVGYAPHENVRAWLFDAIEADAVAGLDVELLTDSAWTAAVEETAFALTCDECGNTVTSEGVTTRVGGDLHQFCCASCEAAFRERYESLADGTEA